MVPISYLDELWKSIGLHKRKGPISHQAFLSSEFTAKSQASPRLNLLEVCVDLWPLALTGVGFSEVLLVDYQRI